MPLQSVYGYKVNKLFDLLSTNRNIYKLRVGQIKIYNQHYRINVKVKMRPGKGGWE